MSDVNSRLVDMWSTLLKCDEVHADTDFFECGGTSIVAVYLAAEVQDGFHVSIDAIEVISHPRFGDLEDLIRSRLEKAAAPN